MQTVHPRFRGNRATVLLNYHGSDTFRFSSTELDPIENVGRFGDRRRFKTLTQALRSLTNDGATTPIVAQFARFIDAKSIQGWEIVHMAKRLILEGVEGIGDTNLASLRDLPRTLAKRGVKIW